MAQADIVAAASPFIASLNGGADPSKPLSNDLDILNFALLLEFLEADFYNANVPKFFK
ncbi:MAG: ferritin-like domain-containing protein [Ktedonobacterales bacterium]|nr:ferritin-like domain-containing protein [Ktedonobacterales bacterium]